MDLLGICIAILGAVTVVLASNTSDLRLDPAGLLRAISQKSFIAYSIVYIVAAVILAGLSETNLGRKVVFVDVGLCAIFGKLYETLDKNDWLILLHRRIYCAIYERHIDIVDSTMD